VREIVGLQVFFTNVPESKPEKLHEETLLEKWLAVEDEPDDEFIEKLLKFDLETWDHRTHLRIAWIYLTKYGRKEGLKLIFEGIKNFIANSKRTTRSKGTTFHETLTYFWAHMVHYAISSTKNPTNDFKGFLVMNPQLSNGGLYLKYYKKETMMNNQEARIQVVLPDLLPLPSMITDVSKLSKNVNNMTINQANQPKVLKDEEFIQLFEQKKLNSWGHTQFLRVIFIYLTKKGNKQEVIKEIFTQMEKFHGEGFHLTLTNFWIQVVDLSLAKSGNNPAPMDFVTFFGKAPELQNENLPLDYYKKEVLYSKEAEKSIVSPDKKKLFLFVSK